MLVKLSGRRARIKRLAADFLRVHIARHGQTALRNYPWPIKKRILNAPPLSATRGDCGVIVMTTARDWLDALWSAYSWQYFAPALASPTIVVDGDVTETMRRDVRRIMRGATVSPAASYLPACGEMLPLGDAFLRHYRFGRKVAVVLASSQLKSFVFSDSDVLLFRKPVELLSHIAKRRRVPLCNVERGGDAWNSPDIVELMQSEGIRPIPGFNSGLMYIPADSLDIDLCARCLRSDDARRAHHFAEQSMFNAALSKAGGRPLDPQIYAISNDGAYFYQRDVDYTNLAARHFTGMVRHKMYTAGMPILARTFGL